MLDVTAYTKSDVKNLLDALNPVSQYVLISSSAVYPETLEQPFNENQKTGRNAIWKGYGTNKIEAEEYLFSKIPDAYVIRPPYLYGSQNNLYREAFVFDCAEAKRTFFVPKDGSMKLQFFCIRDLCQFMSSLFENITPFFCKFFMFVFFTLNCFFVWCSILCLCIFKEIFVD